MANATFVGSPVTGTGGIRRGAPGTTLPTDETTELDQALVKMGYAGEDGVTMTTDRTTEKIKAWGGASVRVVQTEFECTFTFALLETNEVSLQASYGDANVEFTPATSSAGNKTAVQVNAEPLGEQVYVFDMKDGDKRGRIVIPVGNVSEVGEVNFVHSDISKRELTIDALPDENGNNAYLYFDDGQKTAAA